MPLLKRLFVSRPLLLLIPAMVFLIYLSHYFQLVNYHELEAIDLRFRLRGERPAHSDITIVAIDDRSLAMFGKWPWPRDIYARFLEIISKFSPRSIFFDILYTEESVDPALDEKLKGALKDAGNVVLPFFYQSTDPFQATFPIPIFREVAKAMGYANIVIDPDGHVRRVKAKIEGDEKIYYHPSVLISLDQEVLDRGLRKNIPLDRDGYFWINFPGTMSSFRVVSMSDLINKAGMNRLDELNELIRNRVIIVGHTATGTGMIDIKATPFSPNDPGVLLMASAAHTLLGRQFLRSIPEWLHLLILLILASGAAFGTYRARPVTGLMTSVLIYLVYLVVNLVLFIFLGVILPVFVPLVVVIASYGVVLYGKYVEVLFQREVSQRELKAAVQIQENFLPKSRPQVPNLDVAFECRFSKGVGGDLYDWIDLGQDRYAFCVGDVSGKGMPAALYMSKTMSDFRSFDKKSLMPGEICMALNDRLASSGVSGMFLTFLYVLVDGHEKKMFYASGGHEHAIYYSAKTKSCHNLEGAQGTPLGLFEGMDYQTEAHSFQSGDGFLLISDGVKELRNDRKEEFGIDRLKDLFQKEMSGKHSAEVIIQNLFLEMQKYQKGIPAHDDRTLLIVRFLG
ncbi:MAG: CHASE2 domain-containing protein [Candidatus Omnitrophica bacterium]|nr:CHASE2 domain-containing protein [Candidatus Omnitrophota bacterium]